jgi:uncharacterized repeat protein (TIGR03803 family)
MTQFKLTGDVMTRIEAGRRRVSRTKQAAGAAWSLFFAVMMAVAVIQPASAQTFTVLHEFAGSPNDGSGPQGGLVRDSAGNFFGTTANGGADSEGSAFKLTPAGRETMLFSFSLSEGAFPASNLVFDAAGNMYGTADEGPGGAGVIFRLAKDGTEVVFHAFQGGQNSVAAVPKGGLTKDAAGNFYGATLLGGLGFGTIYRVDPTGKLKVLYNFQGKADGASPQGPLVRDAAGNIFGSAAEKGSHSAGTIFKLAPDGTLTVLHSFTGTRDGKTPQGGLLLDGAGNLFGSTFGGGDTGNGTIFQVSKNGGFRRLHTFSGAVDGTNPNGALIRDTAGNIFGTAQLGGTFSLGTVFKLTSAGQLIVLHNFTGDEDGATPFSGLLLDAAGNLFGTAEQNFLIDQRGGTVFKITP